MIKKYNLQTKINKPSYLKKKHFEDLMSDTISDGIVSKICTVELTLKHIREEIFINSLFFIHSHNIFQPN